MRSLMYLGQGRIAAMVKTALVIGGLTLAMGVAQPAGSSAANSNRHSGRRAFILVIGFARWILRVRRPPKEDAKV